MTFLEMGRIRITSGTWDWSVVPIFDIERRIVFKVFTCQNFSNDRDRLVRKLNASFGSVPDETAAELARYAEEREFQLPDGTKVGFELSPPPPRACKDSVSWPSTYYPRRLRITRKSGTVILELAEPLLLGELSREEMEKLVKQTG